MDGPLCLQFDQAGAHGGGGGTGGLEAGANGLLFMLGKGEKGGASARQIGGGSGCGGAVEVEVAHGLFSYVWMVTFYQSNKKPAAVLAAGIPAGPPRCDAARPSLSGVAPP
jgi:hypothetical protein